ncbi:MAG: toxin C-terminal domain-containing protein [Phycisphaerae bacterium]
MTRDSHSGWYIEWGQARGVWKMAESVEGLRNKNTRMGTYDSDLNRIGD